MANTESKKLTVDVIARIDKLERGMAKASAIANKQFGAIERRGQQMSAKLATVGANAARSLAAPLLALGAAGLVNAVGDIAKGMAQVGDEAKRAGVSVEAFTELKFVAEQSRVGVDALVDGLKELNLRADEFIVTGGGSAAEAFKRLGFSAEELNQKLADPSALFSEIIGKLGALDKAAQIRIADEIFGGTGGEQFVQLIEQGEAGIARSVQQARDLGLVLSDDLVKSAAELDRQFNLVANTVGSALKTAIVEAATALGGFFDQFRQLNEQQVATLEGQMRDLGLERVRIENSLITNPRKGRGDTREPRLREILAEEARILAEYERRQVLWQPGTPTGAETRAQAAATTRPATVPQIEAQLSAAEKLIESLEFEAEQLGRTAREQAIYNALHTAGAEATTAQEARIRELVGANYDLAASQEKVAETNRLIMDTAESTFRGMVDDLLAGKDAADIFADALKNIGGQLINLGIGSIFGTGGGSGLFGELLGIPGRANGGPVSAGQPYIVGERRPELFVPNTSGRIIPHVPSIPKMGGGGGVVINFAPVIDATGADAAAISRLSGQLAQMKAELPATVVGAVRKARATGNL